MGAKLTQKIFLKIHNSGSPASNGQISWKKWNKEDGETRIAMDSTFYLGSKSARDAMTGQLLTLGSTRSSARARVFFLTAKNEWINWAIINYPIIASEKLTLPYSKIEEKKNQISSANPKKKCFIKVKKNHLW